MNSSRKKELDNFIMFLKTKPESQDLQGFALNFYECIPQKFSAAEAIYISEKYFNMKYFQSSSMWEWDVYPLIRVSPFVMETRALTGTRLLAGDITEEIIIKNTWEDFKRKSFKDIKKAFVKEASFDEI